MSINHGDFLVAVADDPRFIQYAERQVVLFDAIEDAAFTELNNLEGAGSVRDVRERAEGNGLGYELRSFLKTFKVHTVLTAHPTQFYPDSVLGIITDGNIRRMMEKEFSLTDMHARDIMNPNPKTIGTDELAVNALEQMRKYEITQLVVEKNNHYAGIIHLHDLVREGLI